MKPKPMGHGAQGGREGEGERQQHPGTARSQKLKTQTPRKSVPSAKRLALRHQERQIAEITQVASGIPGMIG